ncbi:hypothetical protein Despr_0600 [Desulfobulbus propionicus DSM 2032]|uniref:Uncharacterized protein n=1 Tax=Desulfobulbus propionicus (strain ATCC 33891 / DSM 2032 / VKM B-1956 / 1pr3) TaxID=577650 RepID=A0A7U3YJZ2_DESPD|nr:hypothetical protein [Desulfobulbus propionicus]ADW16776.1 hypothetical protein Despr_0600 [Desulfobulbus propionicus DSM 2032]
MANIEVPAPFKALLSGWSLIVVVLSVAGYSFRWNYYYNFGLQSLVLSAPLESLPVYAIEIARNPRFFIDLLQLGLVYLLPCQLTLLALRRAADVENEKIRTATRFVVHALALDKPLLVDALLALLLLIVAFQAGGEAGYRAYLTNAAEGTSRLPKVTVISRIDSKLPFIGCNTSTFKKSDPSMTPRFVGEPSVIDSLMAGKACTSEQWSWRLLLRDEKFVYLFATVKDPKERPETLVLPNSEDITLVFR